MFRMCKMKSSERENLEFLLNNYFNGPENDTFLCVSPILKVRASPDERVKFHWDAIDKNCKAIELALSGKDGKCQVLIDYHKGLSFWS